MGFMTVYGFMNGDVTKLLAPIDGHSQFCGVNNGVAKDGPTDLTNYPYLYIGDLLSGSAKAMGGDLSGAFSSAVCVKECPKDVSGSIAVECKAGTDLCN